MVWDVVRGVCLGRYPLEDVSLHHPSIIRRRAIATLRKFAVLLSKQDGAVPQTPLSPGGGLMGRLKQFGKVSGRDLAMSRTPS